MSIAPTLPLSDAIMVELPGLRCGKGEGACVLISVSRTRYERYQRVIVLKTQTNVKKLMSNSPSLAFNGSRYEMLQLQNLLRSLSPLPLPLPGLVALPHLPRLPRLTCPLVPRLQTPSRPGTIAQGAETLPSPSTLL